MENDILVEKWKRNMFEIRSEIRMLALRAGGLGKGQGGRRQWKAIWYRDGKWWERS